MRVDEATLSMVATRRNANSLSGAKDPSARHAPLNSSIWTMSARILGVMTMLSVLSIAVNIAVNSHKQVVLCYPFSKEAPFGASKAGRPRGIHKWPAEHKITKTRFKFEKNHHHCRTQRRWKNHFCP